jgi:peptidyl-tRNA hydrolase, PTH1 family
LRNPFRSGGGGADWLVVGLGNPGREYAPTRHNVGFRVAEALIARWDLPRPRERFRGRITEGRVEGVRVAVLCPQTYMNDAGRSVGPARGALKVALEHVLVVHDEIDLPFGEIQTRLGGGLAGHNGLKSLRQGLGSADFMRARLGVGRPDSTDPEVVSAYVLGRFTEDAAAVGDLVKRGADAVEEVVLARNLAGERGAAS